MFEPKLNIKEISIDEVHKMLQEKHDFVLLDVRTEGEVSRGKIDGSINIPLDNLPGMMNEKLSDKSKMIVVYCLTGSRSAIACDYLTKNGYTNVHNMTNGILAWRAMKYETTS